MVVALNFLGYAGFLEGGEVATTRTPTTTCV